MIYSYTYIYHKDQPTVGEYTIHGSYGHVISMMLSDISNKKLNVRSLEQMKDQNKLEVLRILPEQNYGTSLILPIKHPTTVQSRIIYSSSSLPPTVMGKKDFMFTKEVGRKNISTKQVGQKEHLTQKRFGKKNNNTLPKEVRLEKEPLKLCNVHVMFKK